MEVSYLSTLRSSNDRDFDEDKCRNVLVRYAGHICKNYNYQDGVPEVRRWQSGMLPQAVILFPAAFYFLVSKPRFQFLIPCHQVFLILREHMGDKTLDLAGGVLYELIEIDCTYSHEPGACFQRWRHDHMRRYVSNVSRFSSPWPWPARSLFCFVLVFSLLPSGQPDLLTQG